MSVPPAPPSSATVTSEPPRLPLPPPAHEAPLPSARETAAGVRVFSGVAYAAVPGIRPLELDLWLPPGEGPFPAVLFLHGGGWRLGSRRSAGPAYARAQPGPFEKIAQAGVAVASADYRLSGEATWPAQVHDAKAAARWLRGRAGETGIDPERIAAWGESAGGHLAELLGFTAGDTALEGDVGVSGPRSDVAAVVAWYAPSDLTTVTAEAGLDPTDPTTREAQLLGAPATTVPDIAAQASPISHVSAGVPPVLLLHGRADRFIPCTQSEKLQHALDAVGADVELHLYDGSDHMWLGASDAAADALDRTITFLRTHLLRVPDSKGDSA
jgi:acetyl esterase/lipase